MGAIFVATITTFAFHETIGLEASQPFVILVDAALLAFTTYVAVKSVYYWPLWFSGFHMIAVATGLARIAFPSSLTTLYTNTAGFWAIPALSAAVAGVYFDRRMAD